MSLVRFRAQNHPQQQAKDAIDDRATTPEMFAELHERFNFTVDVAAAAHNAKLPRFYSREQSGLEVSWSGERVWCNPPYSSIRLWVEKAWMARDHAHRWIEHAEGTLFTEGAAFRFCSTCDREEWANGVVRPGHGEQNPAELVVMLLPANRTEQGWWQDLVEPHLRARAPGFRVEFLPGRIRFIKVGSTSVGPNERPPFGCCLLIWGDEGDAA